MYTSSFDSEAPVLVIGAAGVDVVGRETVLRQAGTSNPANIRSSFGGVARNVAENLARLGQPVTLLTAVGDDQIGTQLLQYTEESGVDVQHCVRSTEYPTGTYLAVLDEMGSLNFALDDMRAIGSLTPSFVRGHYQLFKDAAMIFFDANLHPKTLNTIIYMAQKAKKPVCGDPTSSSLAVKLQPHLEKIQIITANSKEASILTGQPIDPTDHQQALNAARMLVAQGVDFAIVTVAEFGLGYATAERSGHIPALHTEVINPTGAGDALIAAVLFALLNNIPEDEAVRLGISAASLTLRHPGAVVPELSLELLYDHLVF